MINENRMEGSLRDLGGKVQDAVGGLTGNEDVQARGKANQIAGQAQNMVGVAVDQAWGLGGQVIESVKRNPVPALLATAFAGFLLGAWTRR